MKEAAVAGEVLGSGAHKKLKRKKQAASKVRIRMSQTVHVQNPPKADEAQSLNHTPPPKKKTTK